MTNDVTDTSQLKKIVKSDIALAAIFHTIHRVKQFNNGYFPFRIKSLRIGGSSLRIEKPKDIDLFVEAHAISNLWQEWRRFDETLNSKMYEIYNLAHELCEIGEKATIGKVIEKAKDRLVKLGFEAPWIENWLPWVRISDIKWGLDRSGIIAYFSEDELISRFIKDGWKGKRLEIHVLSYDLEGQRRDAHGDVPSVMIWEAEKGIVIPETADRDRHLLDERAKLLELSNNLIRIIESTDERQLFDAPKFTIPRYRC